MMNEKFDFEKIEGFLSDDLIGDELLEFENQLLDNPDLQQEVDLLQEIDMAIMEDDVMDLRSKLEAIEPPQSPKVRRSMIYMGKWHLVAASLIILIGIGSIMYMMGNSNYSEEDIYGRYYKPYNVIINTRSVEAHTSKLLVNALKSYEAKEYTTALSLFQQVLEKDSLNITGNFYSGISNIEIKKYNAANKNFNRIIQHKNNLFIEQSEWYLGFCYLMTNKKEEAIRQFHTIAQSNSFYKEKAQEILNRLE